MWPTRLWVPVVGFTLGVAGAHGQELPGYSIGNNVLRVETRDHWRGWDIAVGAATITADGSAFPRFYRKRVNLALEGRTDAGSNAQFAHRVIDGDPATFWEPDLRGREEDWWIQVHLGRVAIVDSVVLRFVEEDQGEPFRQFLVVGWRRPPPLEQSRYNIFATEVSAFWDLFKTDRPTIEQRRFQFVPRTTEKANDSFEGDPLEVIHILVTDSRGLRLREVGEGTYFGLPPEDRGTVDYYRRSASGRQTQTTESIYRELDPRRQGRIRYFARERPRLAEVEVWVKGDDLNHGAVTRGARNTIHFTRFPRGPFDLGTSITDGNPNSGPTTNRGQAVTVLEDLGTLYWVEVLDFLSYGGASVFHVDLSDGTLAPDGSILWTRAASDRTGADFKRFEIEPTRVRFLRILFNAFEFSLTEVMLYGEGYVAEAVLNSPFIELGNRKGLVSIEWDSYTPEGTGVDITTRTGNTLSEAYIYHDNTGKVVTEKRYNTRLPNVKKGEITAYPIAGRDFSDWSAPYAGSGEEVRSPRNRRYLQLQARILADTTSKYGPPAELHSIRVTLADLYTDKVIGEVWPTRVDRIGEPEVRSYYLRPLFGNSGQGFDQVRIVASAPTRLEALEVRAGSERDFREGSQRVFPADQLERFPTTPDSLILQLPRMLQRGVDLVEVRMRSTLYGHSAAFEASVKASDTDGSWQLAEVGDASAEVFSQTNVVVALADNRVLSRLRVEPPVFTPNHDGFNDEVFFVFEVTRVIGRKEIALSIYDLSGRRVHRLTETRPDPRGVYRVPWAGVKHDGDPVPPGVYVVRLELDTDSDRAQSTRRTRTVSVVY